MNDEQRQIVERTIKTAVHLIEDLPLGYLTEDEHIKLESYADRCTSALWSVIERPETIHQATPRD